MKGILCWLTMFIVLLAGQPAIASETPEELVEATINRVSNRLITDHQLIVLNPGYLDHMIEQEVQPLVDYRGMARSAMGKYWSRASASQQQQFSEAFRRRLIHQYAEVFRKYQGQSTEVLGKRYPDKQRAIILTRMNTINGNLVNYRLTVINQKWKLTDVIIDGVSLVQTAHDQVQAMIQDNGMARAIVMLADQNPDQRQHITLGSDDWAPYSSAQLPSQGLAADLVRSILESLGYHVNLVFQPVRKIQQQLDNNEIDGILATTLDKQSTLLMTDAYLTSRLQLASASENPLSPDLLLRNDSDNPVRIGIYSELQNSPMLDDFKGSRFEIFDYCAQTLREVATGKLDGALVDSWAASLELTNNPAIRERVRLSEQAIATADIFLGINPSIPNSENIITSFNLVLQRMRDNSQYDSILTQHQYPK